MVLARELHHEPRVLVLYEGAIMGEFSGDHVDLERLGLLMAGVRTPAAEVK